MRRGFIAGFVIMVGALTAGPSTQSTVESTSHQQAARIPDPIVESFEIVDVSSDVRQKVLERIGLRVGDMLTVDAKHRIGREIGNIQKGMTFTYLPGVAPGKVIVRIDASC